VSFPILRFNIARVQLFEPPDRGSIGRDSDDGTRRVGCIPWTARWQIRSTAPVDLPWNANLDAAFTSRRTTAMEAPEFLLRHEQRTGRLQFVGRYPEFAHNAIVARTRGSAKFRPPKRDRTVSSVLWPSVAFARINPPALVIYGIISSAYHNHPILSDLGTANAAMTFFFSGFLGFIFACHSIRNQPFPRHNCLSISNDCPIHAVSVHRHSKFHSSLASAALYILLSNGGNRCTGETFVITIRPIVCSGLVSM
jgi:hypothetical protein